MNRQLTLGLLLTCFMSIAADTCKAEQPWQKLILFKRVEADPNKSYPLTENNGPWSIMAMTFRGDDAAKHARELVYELRKVHKLPAYTYEKTYDYTGDVQGIGWDKYGRPKTMKYMHDERIQEVAVLVGDYDSVDDSRAQKILKELKFLQPESLALEKGRGTSQAFGTLRRMQQKIMRDEDDRAKGPMRHAFVTTNPLLPREFFAPKGIDKLVLDMNKDVKYSLLNCPGKFTVQIATFNGYVVLDQKKIEQLENGEIQAKSRLAKAAMRAHKLTETLRAQGVEAYEFHDRYESIVTVGSFASAGTPRADGKMEINPQMHAVMLKYKGDQSNQAAQIQSANGKKTVAGVQAKRIAGVTLDIQPMPIEVPRRSISSDYIQVNYEE